MSSSVNGCLCNEVFGSTKFAEDEEKPTCRAGPTEQRRQGFFIHVPQAGWTQEKGNLAQDIAKPSSDHVLEVRIHLRILEEMMKVVTLQVLSHQVKPEEVLVDERGDGRIERREA